MIIGVRATIYGRYPYTFWRMLLQELRRRNDRDFRKVSMTGTICKTSTRRQIDRGAASVQSFIYYLGCVLDMSFLHFLLFDNHSIVYTREAVPHISFCKSLRLNRSVSLCYECLLTV